MTQEEMINNIAIENSINPSEHDYREGNTPVGTTATNVATPAKKKREKKVVTSGKTEENKKETDEKRFKLELYPADDTIVDCPLSELVPLDSTPINGASYAMREINQNHLASIQEAVNNNESLPDMTVVRSNMGFIVLDGYHRWLSYETYLKEAIGEAEGEGDILSKARSQFKVGIKTVTVENDHALLIESFKANLRHGLPASIPSRSRYAMFLFEDAKALGSPISVREAGRQALVSHVMVLKAMKKEAERQNKMIDQLVGPEDAQDVADYEATEGNEDAQKLSKQSDTTMKNIVKACKYFNKLDMTKEELMLYMSGYANDVNKEEVETLIWVLTGLMSKALPPKEPEQKKLLS